MTRVGCDGHCPEVVEYGDGKHEQMRAAVLALITIGVKVTDESGDQYQFTTGSPRAAPGSP